VAFLWGWDSRAGAGTQLWATRHRLVGTFAVDGAADKWALDTAATPVTSAVLPAKETKSTGPLTVSLRGVSY